MSAANARRGKEFERWLAIYYGKLAGLASRVGHEMAKNANGIDINLGHDVEGEFFAIQAKKGVNFYPRKLAEALVAARRNSGRKMPMVVAALPGDNEGHIVTMYGRDFKRILEVLREHGLADRLLIGAQFGGELGPLNGEPGTAGTAHRDVHLGS